MPIFRVENGSLRRLQIAPLGKERDLQRLIEANLQEALGLHFLATEYVTTTGGRIDTVAVDRDGSPVIIEYKRNQNHNVINQALSYLLWLTGQKPGFFEKLMIDQLGASVAAEIKLDWASPRVICIAENYNRFDKDTVKVVPLRIELLRYRFYADGVFSLESDVVADDWGGAAAAGKPRGGPKVGEAADVTAASPTPLTSPTGTIGATLYADLREWLLTLDEGVVERPTKTYVAYRVTRNFAEVHFRKDFLLVYVRPGDFPDPHGMLESIPDSYNWTLNRRIYIRNEEQLEWAKDLIEQSYRSLL